ncbi:hypothetical protein, partial [Treponema pedis]|uniref:hypothetical protein n=1 Tax=Treponema pedis TaxID=409322 RepID=UPI001CEFA41D
MYEKIESRREDFYKIYILHNRKWSSYIEYISRFVKEYEKILIKKIETYMIPSISLLIFRKKKLNAVN